VVVVVLLLPPLLAAAVVVEAPSSALASSPGSSLGLVPLASNVATNALLNASCFVNFNMCSRCCCCLNEATDQTWGEAIYLNLNLNLKIEKQKERQKYGAIK